MCSQLPDAIMVAAHSCCEPTLCSRSCNRGELAMVSAARKAMTMLMPIPARAFMPAGDLVDARHCASFQTLVISQRNNRNGGSGESRLLACSSRQPAANRFQAHIRLAKEDIRRSGRMQQAGSLRSPDPRLRSRQWNNCDVGTKRRCCVSTRRTGVVV